ncbi:MAG: hypothetical protein ACJ786_27990, partial [Catenulispora sp.]
MPATQPWLRAELIGPETTLGPQLMIPADSVEFHEDQLVFQAQGEVVYVAHRDQLRAITWYAKQPNPALARRRSLWPNHGTRWTDDQRTDLRHRLQQGQTWRTISTAAGRSRAGCQQEAIKQGWIDPETLIPLPALLANDADTPPDSHTPAVGATITAADTAATKTAQDSGPEINPSATLAPIASASDPAATATATTNTTHDSRPEPSLATTRASASDTSDTAATNTAHDPSTYSAAATHAAAGGANNTAADAPINTAHDSGPQIYPAATLAPAANATGAAATNTTHDASKHSPAAARVMATDAATNVMHGGPNTTCNPAAMHNPSATPSPALAPGPVGDVTDAGNTTHAPSLAANTDTASADPNTAVYQQSAAPAAARTPSEFTSSRQAAPHSVAATDAMADLHGRPTVVLQDTNYAMAATDASAHLPLGLNAGRQDMHRPAATAELHPGLAASQQNTRHRISTANTGTALHSETATTPQTALRSIATAHPMAGENTAAWQGMPYPTTATGATAAIHSDATAIEQAPPLTMAAIGVTRSPRHKATRTPKTTASPSAVTGAGNHDPEAITGPDTHADPTFSSTAMATGLSPAPADR